MSERMGTAYCRTLWLIHCLVPDVPRFNKSKRLCILSEKSSALNYCLLSLDSFIL